MLDRRSGSDLWLDGVCSTFETDLKIKTTPIRYNRIEQTIKDDNGASKPKRLGLHKPINWMQESNRLYKYLGLSSDSDQHNAGVWIQTDET